MRATRHLIGLMLALNAAGCTRYDCAEFRLFDDTFGEQCGPAGSQGNLYFEDQMVNLIIGAGFEDFLTEESSIVYDYVPTIRIGFRSVHLTEGEQVSEDETVVICSRTEGLGTSYISWPGTATVEVVEPSNRTQVGGQSWRFRWSAECDPQADMSAEGDDIIELFVDEFGWDFDLFGVPPDWPE